MSRRGARLYHTKGNRDRNEKPIVELLRKRGFCVTQIQGRGVPDLLVSYDWPDPRMWLVEIKQPKATHTEAQKTFRKNWRGPAIWTLRTVDEALRFPAE